MVRIYSDIQIQAGTTCHLFYSYGHSIGYASGHAGKRTEFLCESI